MGESIHFPWLKYLDEQHRREFFADISRVAYEVSVSVNARMDGLDAEISSWKSTAEVHSDPELYAALMRQIDGEDPGLVTLLPMPEPLLRHHYAFGSQRFDEQARRYFDHCRECKHRKDDLIHIGADRENSVDGAKYVRGTRLEDVISGERWEVYHVGPTGGYIIGKLYHAFGEPWHTYVSPWGVLEAHTRELECRDPDMCGPDCWCPVCDPEDNDDDQ
jgi:hypothetical protein